MSVLANPDIMRRRFDDFVEWNETAMRLGPAGYYVSIHRRSLCAAEASYATLSPEWIRYYRRHMFALRDPLLHWGLINEGTIRWSNVDLKAFLQNGYTDRVLDKAQEYGLAYGAVSVLRSHSTSPARSCLVVARSDRELTDAELEETHTLLLRIVASIPFQGALSQGEAELLRLLAHGQTQSEAQKAIGLSASAMKKRLERARTSLGARTTTHAVAIALARGMLQR